MTSNINQNNNYLNATQDSFLTNKNNIQNSPCPSSNSKQIPISPKISMNDLTNNSSNNELLEKIEKLNSNSINEYINSLLRDIRELKNENQELKINFVQVSELREREIKNYEKEINVLKSNIEILEQEKKRHITQNIIEKEALENQINIINNENELLCKRIKEVTDKNEELQKINFDLNLKIMNKNKRDFKTKGKQSANSITNKNNIRKNYNTYINNNINNNKNYKNKNNESNIRLSKDNKSKNKNNDQKLVNNSNKINYNIKNNNFINNNKSYETKNIILSTNNPFKFNVNFGKNNNYLKTQTNENSNNNINIDNNINNNKILLSQNSQNKYIPEKYTKFTENSENFKNANINAEKENIDIQDLNSNYKNNNNIVNLKDKSVEINIKDEAKKVEEENKSDDIFNESQCSVKLQKTYTELINKMKSGNLTEEESRDIKMKLEIIEDALNS